VSDEELTTAITCIAYRLLMPIAHMNLKTAPTYNIFPTNSACVLSFEMLPILMIKQVFFSFEYFITSVTAVLQFVIS
jgi:hypothetical protein